MTAAAPALVTAATDPEAPLRAVVAALRGVASHEDAGRLWGIDLVQASAVRHVTVARCRSRATYPATKVHRADLEDVADVAGIPVTSAVRTVVDLCRTLPHAHALRPSGTQHLVRVTSGTIGRVDFAWPDQRLVVEVDGYAFHADRSTYRNDRRRGNALVLAGWRVLRFSWEDVVGSPEVVVAQVRAALAV